MGKISLYVAAEQMKRTTIFGEIFSIEFRKRNRQMWDGGDMMILAAVRLRKKATDENVGNSSYKLLLMDVTTGRSLSCWEYLVVEFDGKRIAT